MKIKDVMTKECNWISPNATLAEAAKVMKDKDIGFVAIGENDKLIGTITDRDLAIRAVAENLAPSTAVKAVMTQKVMYCYEDQSVEEICENMSDIKVRRLPVVNKDKRLVGTVSLGDISQAKAQESGEALQQITVCNKSKARAA